MSAAKKADITTKKKTLVSHWPAVEDLVKEISDKTGSDQSTVWLAALLQFISSGEDEKVNFIKAVKANNGTADDMSVLLEYAKNGDKLREWIKLQKIPWERGRIEQDAQSSHRRG
jgi:hypothetical protein